jgi:hypothetical protein
MNYCDDTAEGPKLQTFKDYPPRAKSGSFSLDQVLEKMHVVAATKRPYARAVAMVVGALVVSRSDAQQRNW